MSASSSSPRPLAGLAAAALVVGLIGAPLVAYADPSPSPSPTVSAADAPSPTATTKGPRSPSSSSSSSSTATASPSESESASDPESPSGPPSPSDDATSDETSPSPDVSSPARVGQDAIESPGPTESAAPTPEVTGQAVGRREHHPGQIGLPGPGVEGRSGGHLPLRRQQQRECDAQPGQDHRRARGSEHAGLQPVRGDVGTGSGPELLGDRHDHPGGPGLRRPLQLRQRVRQLPDPGVTRHRLRRRQRLRARHRRPVPVDRAEGFGEPDRDGRPGRSAPLPRHGDQHRQRHSHPREDHQQPRFPRSRLRTVGPGDPGPGREHQLRGLLSSDHGGRTPRPSDQRTHRTGGTAVRCDRLQQRRRHR